MTGPQAFLVSIALHLTLQVKQVSSQPQELVMLYVNAALFSNQHILHLIGQDMLQFHCHLVVNIKIYCSSTGPKSELFVCLLGSDL